MYSDVAIPSLMTLCNVQVYEVMGILILVTASTVLDPELTHLLQDMDALGPSDQ